MRFSGPLSRSTFAHLHQSTLARGSNFPRVESALTPNNGLYQHGIELMLGGDRAIVDRAIRRELDYAIPEVLAGRVSIGARVRVPFRDRSALATVVALVDETSASGIREIEAIIGESPTLSPALLEMARWIS